MDAGRANHGDNESTVQVQEDYAVLFALPANWRTLSDSALRGQLATIIEMAATVDPDAPAGFVSDDGSDGGQAAPSGLDQLEAYADAKEAIEAELAERDEAAQAEADRRQAVMDRFAADPEPEPEEAPAEEVPAEEVPAEEAAELAAATPAAAEEPAPAAAPAEEAAPAPSAEAATAAMAARNTPTTTPGAGSDDAVERRLRTTSQLGSADVDPGTEVDIDHMSELLADRLHNLTSWHGSRDFERAFRANWNFSDDEMLGQSEKSNYAVFANAKRGYTEEQETLVASGGPCAPLQPSYEFFQCFSPQRPIEAFLPTVGAPRGGIRYIQPPNFTEAQAAIDTKDSTALATTPGSGWVDKNCSRVSCPSETELTVAAVSSCVTFDNLNFRVFPEQVRDFLERVQAMHSRAKEIYYLDRIDQLATAAVDIADATNGTPPAYGAVRSFYRELKTIAHNYRKRNNMNKDAVLDMLLPDVVEEILAVDMTNDHSVGMSVAAGAEGNMLQVLARKAGINLGFYYYDSAEAGFPASEHNAAITANYSDIELPSVIRSYLWAPGSIVRLDAGTLDVGPVRDSSLNRTNDVELFAEQWVEVANVGCEVNAFDHTLCPSGTGPVGVTALAC